MSLMSHKRVLIFLGILLAGATFLMTAQDDAVFNYVFNKNANLQQDEGRINVLLLGIGGGSHDGPNLTDTIMVASYDTDTHKATLVSLPRDLWLDQYKNKVNAVYQLGLDQGNGLGLAREAVGKIMGINIPYAIRVDFTGFVKAVDLIGGIDVNVEHSFDDYNYPISGKEDDMCGYKETIENISPDQAKNLGVQPGSLKVLLNPQDQIATAAASPAAGLIYTDDQVFRWFSCRYAHISFKTGPTHLDGTTALEFVRSRHGTNGEGSDFARSRRQELVIKAFRAKVLSLNTLSDPSKLVGLIQTFGSSIDTNIPQSKYLEFAKLARQVQSIKSYVIDQSGEYPFLINPPGDQYGGAWVLTPAGGNYARIQKFVSDAFADSPEATMDTAINPAASTTVESNVNP